MTINAFQTESAELPLLDIRSPGEYQKGHIPGAISFPLFSNEERAIIGTLYKQEGKAVAIRKGLELVGPKLSEFVREADALGTGEVAMYCWRGGMRSDSMAWLLDKAGFQIRLLKGGYKAYRTQLFDFFTQHLPLVIITGYTGSKKTELLHLLHNLGEQTIDLEGLAQHQGSSFGNQKSISQPSSEHFQNLIYETCRKFELDKTIWVEDECLRIGQVSLIDDLYRQMSVAPRIFIEVDIKERIKFLVEEYGQLPKEKLIDGTVGIQKKLGLEKANDAIECIKNGDLHKAVEIILYYYDRYYEKSIQKKEKLIVKRLQCAMDELPELALHLAASKMYAI